MDAVQVGGEQAALRGVLEDGVGGGEGLVPEPVDGQAKELQDLGGVAAQSDLGAAVVLLLDLGDSDRQRLLVDGRRVG